MDQNHAQRDAALMARALKVLGVEDEHRFDTSRLRHGLHCRMLRHHPDVNDAPDAQLCAALLTEAFGLLTGELVTDNKSGMLLDNDELCERVAGEPLDAVHNAPTYEQWLRTRFLDEENRSVWPT